MNKTLTFSVNGNLGITIAFGCFVALIALIPTAIVAYQWLTGTPKTPPHTDPFAILPGLAIVLWGVGLATQRNPVTVNAEDGTLTFRRSVFGVTYRTNVWRRSEIQAIEIIKSDGIKPMGYSAYVRGDGRSETLLDYSHGDAPQEVRETATLLGLPVRYPQDPKKKWRE